MVDREGKKLQTGGGIRRQKYSLWMSIVIRRRRRNFFENIVLEIPPRMTLWQTGQQTRVLFPYCATGELTSGSGPGCPSTTDSGLSWAQESDTFLSSGWICVSINIFVLPVYCLVVHRNRRHCVLFFCKFNSIGTRWTHSSRDLCPMTPMCDLRDIIDSV